MIAFRSSEECFSSMSLGRTPNSRRIAFETAVSPAVNGRLIQRNAASGAASTMAVPSARLIESIFGTCSPTLMWSEVVSV